MTANPVPSTTAAEFVLGLLEPADQAAAEARLATDPQFAREVEQWRARFGAFDDSLVAPPVDEDLWRRIDASVGAQQTAPAQIRARSSWWHNLALWRGTALAASAATLLLAAGLGLTLKQTARVPLMVAVLMDGERPGAVVEAYDDGTARLIPLTAIPVPEGRTLQVWTLPSRERGPVSVGLMSEARTIRLSLKDLPQAQRDQLFEITLEPAGGSPTGRPTGPILYKGLAAPTL
jgi:anti-sigma-K factor RskA